jgi:hypothetical protein
LLRARGRLWRGERTCWAIGERSSVGGGKKSASNTDPDDAAPDFSEGKSCKACEWRAAAAKSAAEAARARDTLLQAGFFLEALGATGFCLECRSDSEEFLACFFSSAGSLKQH